jgi:hypothetical protein
MQLEPLAVRFTDRFSGVLISLCRNPYKFTEALWDDEPDRRIIRNRDFMDGFEITVGFEINQGTQTVELQWIDRIFIEEPEL